MQTHVKQNDGRLRVETVNDQGKTVSWGSGNIVRMHLNGAEIKALTIGGVGSEPEYRRMGLVRHLMEAADQFAGEQECLVTLLHPFSFDYYRKFGFERVADHRILEFPISALQFVPFFRNMIHCDAPCFQKDLTHIYQTFASQRNIMFSRNAEYDYTGGKRKVYIGYDDDGSPSAYLSFDEENYFCVNHMANGVLNVHEMCFTSPEGLMKLLGFMRMFEGQLESVKIHNCAMAPEMEQTLRHYTHTKISVVPDIMARVNDVGKVLERMRYPTKPGEFTIRVREPERTSHRGDRTNGAWHVRYENGIAQVQRLEADAACDLICDVPAFTQLIFGFQSFGVQAARYIWGTEIRGEAEDFFRAFPNRPCGLFEHF